MEPRTTAWTDDLSEPLWIAGAGTAPERSRQQDISVEPDSNRIVGEPPDRMKPDRTRGDVVDRLLLAGRRLARHRADREWAGEHPIGKHIVVFFYLEPGPDDTRDRLRVATRMFLDGDDVANLRGIILQLHALSREYSAMGRFNPREQLANRVEPMSADAVYVGLGVGTLDPEDIFLPGPHVSDNPPFRGIGVLSDGTRMLARWTGGLDSVLTESTHTLNVGPQPTRTWAWAGTQLLQDESEAGRIGTAVIDLHEFILETSRADIAFRAHHRGATRWGRPEKRQPTPY
jgi:hypothetical protein